METKIEQMSEYEMTVKLREIGFTEELLRMLPEHGDAVLEWVKQVAETE